MSISKIEFGALASIVAGAVWIGTLQGTLNSLDVNKIRDVKIETINEINQALKDQPSFPIGSIIGWHKSLSKEIQLSNKWVECNGQEIRDSESIYDGIIAPSLNSDKRFLRGGHESGKEEDASAILGYPNDTGGCTSITVKNADEKITSQTGNVLTNSSDPSNACGQYGETFSVRPKNMSVTWIMRIK